MKYKLRDGIDVMAHPYLSSLLEDIPTLHDGYVEAEFDDGEYNWEYGIDIPEGYEVPISRCPGFILFSVDMFDSLFCTEEVSDETV